MFVLGRLTKGFRGFTLQKIRENKRVKYRQFCSSVFVIYATEENSNTIKLIGRSKIFKKILKFSEEYIGIKLAPLIHV